jgi:Cys-tRNA(Pro)/Cys-tRNA(Cys) deacylase
MSETNAVKWLHTQGVSFQVLEYEFTEVGADHAAEAVGRPLEMVCKTLVVRTPDHAFWLAIVPGDQRFDTRSMAAAIGAPRADLAETADAEKITGYKIGGISPFAQRRKLSVVIEESLLALDTIIVNGGRRGVLVELATADLVRLLDAQPADLCHP